MLRTIIDNLNGKVIAEINASGTVQRQYAYLNSAPLAQFEANGSVTYLHTDHLGTPRRGTDAVGRLVWSWESDGFGADAPSGSVMVNLRFAGQYFDSETSLHYNYFRDYDPSTGRYVQSDPIGLLGGMNTYAYVEGNPLKFIDYKGLSPCKNDPKTCLEKSKEEYDQCLGTTDSTFKSCKIRVIQRCVKLGGDFTDCIVISEAVCGPVSSFGKSICDSLYGIRKLSCAF